MAIKRFAKDSTAPKKPFEDFPLENMSPAVRTKAEAWLKADAAAKEAKRVFSDTASAAARKAKVIGADQYLGFAIGFGGTPRYCINDAGETKAAVKTAAVKF